MSEKKEFAHTINTIIQGDTNMKRKIKNIGIDVIFDILGALIYNTGIFSFVKASNIAPGGVSGIAIMLNFLYGLPVGTMSLILNIPVMILGWKYLGRSLIYRTFRTLLISTVLMDGVVARFFPQYMGDRLISCLFGGALMGFGLAIIFMRGSTTGGTDILSNLVKLKFPHMPIGRAILFIDCIILLVSIAVFNDIEAGLYGMISLFCCTKVIDGIVYGVDKNTKMMVVSKHNRKIADLIISGFGRGSTLLRGYGAYTENDVDVLMCVCRKQEYFKIKHLIYEIDADAFIVVSEVNEVIGEGFAKITTTKKE